MRISLLKKRESFNQIFISSLSCFLNKKFNWKGNIEWDDSKGTQFLSNSYLNVIYPARMQRDYLTSLTREFAYHPQYWRKLIQFLYVHFAVRKPFEFLLSSSSISISNLPEECENWVFLPGNHSIRIIDVVENRCYVFVKTGFNMRFLEADVLTRIDYDWLPAPFVIKRGDGWYEEQRVFGLPWNRLPFLTQRTHIIGKANSSLSQLYQCSKQSIPLGEYLDNLVNSIEHLLSTSLNILSAKDLAFIRQFMNNIQLLLSRDKNKEILLVITHGDYQPGNILCSDNEFWIIDWEYSSRRSVFYDALVFDLEARCVNLFSSRFFTLLEKIENKQSFYSWTESILTGKTQYYVFIFLLEDLLLKLQELAVESIYSKSELLAGYLLELAKIEASFEN